MQSQQVYSLLFDAGLLMLVGMLFVFAFLCLLIGVVSFTARWLSGEPDNPIEPSLAISTSFNTSAVCPVQLAAISAAIHVYRAQHSSSEHRE